MLRKLEAALVLPLLLAGPVLAQEAAPVTSLASSGFKTGTESTTGAYFYKVSTPASANNQGVTGTGVLPTPVFDSAREHTPDTAAGESEYDRGPLDIPSIYMGGNAGTELDAGLSWSRVMDANKTPLWTDEPDGSDGRSLAHQFRIDLTGDDPTMEAIDGNGNVYDLYAVSSFGGRTPIYTADQLDGARVALVTPSGSVAETAVMKPDFAFRPFWRTMTAKPSGSGYVNTWANPEPGDPGYQWYYPGESFSMTLEVVGKEKVELEIAASGHPGVVTKETFAQANFGTGKPITFKRVDSIDQFTTTAAGKKVGNEDGKVIPTTTKVLGAQWTSFSLIRSNGAKLPGVGPAFVEEHGAEFSAQEYNAIFHRSGFTSAGGETISIEPPAPSRTIGLVGGVSKP
jgi:hypothetical protein